MGGDEERGRENGGRGSKGRREQEGIRGGEERGKEDWDGWGKGRERKRRGGGREIVKWRG